MHDILRTTKPLLLAFASTVLGILAFAALSAAGFGAETSLIAGLVLAGFLNISTLASLNPETMLPTSP